MKVCTKCKTTKPVTDFKEKAKYEDGRDGRCIECRQREVERVAAYTALNKERVKAQQAAWVAANREHVLARQLAWRERNRRRLIEQQNEYAAANQERILAQRAVHYAENRERILSDQAEYYAGNRDKILARRTAWRAANPEIVAARAAAYYAKNRERLIAKGLAWQAAHPEHVKARQARRRARKLGAVTDGHTMAELAAYYVDNGLTECVYCGAPPTASDHIIPLVRGGSHTLDNLVPACTSCNCSKGPKLLSEWRPDHWLNDAAKCG